MSDSAPRPPNSSSSASSIPAKIGRYEVIDKVGSGRTGTVYRATDPFIGRLLAIKTFRLDLAPGAQRDRFLQRFYHEARISGGLAHPNIVTLFDVGEMDGLPYLVFEHVEGPTLDVAIARLGRLDPIETIRIVEQIAAALDFAHAHGVVHRDIRPPNIILGNDKRVRVADFGIARLEGSQLTQLGEILGTPAYMSPELIRGYELTAESDLFALAICAYEMLSGHRPFGGATQAELLDAIVNAPPAEPKDLRAMGIPSRDFMFVFERALAKDPTHRFADGASFSRALKSCLGMAIQDEEPPLVAKIAAPEFKPKPAPPAALSAPTPPPMSPPSSRLIGVVAPPPPVKYRPGGAPPPAPPISAGLATTAAIVSGPAGPHAVSPADATMLGPGAAEDELPLTIQLPRLPPQSEASKVAVVPTTRDMVRPSADVAVPAAGRADDKTMIMSGGEHAAMAKAVPGIAPQASKSDDNTMVMSEPERAAVARMGSTAATSPDAMPAATPSSQNPAEKTVMMTPSEKAAVARMKPGDRSQRPAPALSATQSRPAIGVELPASTGAMPTPGGRPPAPSSPKPPPAPLPGTKTGGIPRPTGPSAAPMGAQPSFTVAGRPSMAPKILFGLVVLLALLALAIGAVFLQGPALRARPALPEEKWNGLKVYPQSEVTKPPIVDSQELPRPKMEPGRVVSVTVSWIVTPEGRVDDPKIMVSASKEIDAMMLEAVRKWRYEPAEKDGKAVPVRVLRKYTFGQRASEGS